MYYIYMEYLTEIAIRILQVVPHGLSKVKFAKTIYFVHKQLVKNFNREVTYMGFIRMPLGPVPDGFMKLDTTEIEIVHVQNELSFDSQVYKCSNVYFEDTLQGHVDKIVKGLNKFTTYDLVDISHCEPSWINHHNGEKYFLTEEDLKTVFPKANLERRNHSFSDQNLQAKLVEGMLNDIVEESTLLEYPDS